MTKVVIPTAVMLAVALGIFALAEGSLRNVTAQMHEIIQVTAARQAEALVAAASINGVAADEKNAMLMTDKAGLDVFASAYVTDLDHLKNSIATLKGMPGNSVETDRLDRITRAIDAYGSTGEQLYQLMVDREFDKAHALSTGAAQDARERLIGLIRDEVDQSTAQMKQAERAADTQYHRTLGLLTGLSVGGLICALMMAGWITQRFIVRPLTMISSSMGLLSQGDLTIQIDRGDRRDEIGTLERALMVFRDRSVALNEYAEKLKTADQEIREMNGVLERRVEQRTEELRAAQDELLKKERLSVLGQLTATVAHELRNPLSSIRNTLFAMREVAATSGSALERMAGRIERSVARCDAIISDLLDYTRVRPLKESRVKLDDWLDEVLAEQKMTDGTVLERRLAAVEAQVMLDSDRFRRVIINLIENAVQAMEPGRTERRITVATSVDDAALIEIADTGPGIPLEILPTVFEPLFSTKSFGTGLGLPTVKQIVEQHGGFIQITSVPGAGTNVSIRLPLAETALAA